MNTTSENEREIQKRNFRYVQIDAVGVSISNVAAPFLPVFLTRLGASNFQIGLLSSMPGMTGLILAILVGRFLQTRTNVVPWYSLSRLTVILCYALTGILTLTVSEKSVIIATLALLAMILYIPSFASFFKITSLNGMQISWAIAMAFVSVIWFELHKWGKRKRSV